MSITEINGQINGTTLEDNFSNISDGTDMHYNTEWTSFTPSWTTTGTAPSIQNGSITGRYIKIGRLVVCHYKFVVGSSTTFGTGNWLFSLPFNNSTSDYPTNHHPAGTAYIEDLNTAGYDGIVRILSNYQNRIWFTCINATGTYIGDGSMSSTVPFTWGTGDYACMEFMYESAS